MLLFSPRLMKAGLFQMERPAIPISAQLLLQNCLYVVSDGGDVFLNTFFFLLPVDGLNSTMRSCSLLSASLVDYKQLKCQNIVYIKRLHIVIERVLFGYAFTHNLMNGTSLATHP